MREIKFRAWDLENNYMFQIKCLNFQENGDIKKVNSLILMQYTGLKDKNDVEIYEGDIINNGYENLEILWNEDRCCFDMRGRYDRSYIIRQLDCDIVLDLNIKVIGNNIENTELLESN